MMATRSDDALVTLADLVLRATARPCERCGGTGRPAPGDEHSRVFCACVVCDGTGNGGVRAARALARVTPEEWAALVRDWQRLREATKDRAEQTAPSRCG